MGRHASKFVKELSKSDRKFLENVWRNHQAYSARCRAHAILLSSQGFTVAELQEIFEITKPTALAWLNRWQEAGRDGLEDEPRPGGPPILDEQEQEMVKEFLKRFPRQPKRVIRAIQETTGKLISRSTLRRLARKLGFRWKRFRRSRKKHRDNRLFHLAMEEIEELRAMPDLELAYFDESAFSLQGVVPYGWQLIDERADVPLGTERGNIQVLGVQEEEGETFGYLHCGRVSGSTVAAVLEDYSHRISSNTMLILDNATVHTCNLVAEKMATWNERGLFFYFLPPYSPELNDMEHLWRKLKYQSLPISAWESFSSLLENLVHAFRDIGQPFLMPSLQ